MTNGHPVPTNNIHRSFLNTEAIVLGFILGGLITLYAGMAYVQGEHLVHFPIEETLWTAIYLTFLVGFVGFKFPTFFTNKPRLAVFSLVMVAGHISLVFDSFAVILLLSTLTMLPLTEEHRHHFNSFAIKAICSFVALTVGGAFYLGELWGLPYYISSGFDEPLAGFPLLLVLTPYCVVCGIIAAKFFPVNVQHVPFDKQQLKGAVKFAAFLILLIVTHAPILCIGLLLLFSALTGRTQLLVHNGMHEISEGAASALGLILAALLVQHLPGTQEWIAENVFGARIMALSVISSPFAGAMLPGTTDVHQFYVNLSWIKLGAPLLVSSSLVAIVVFKESLFFEDLPRWMQRFPGVRDRGFMQEAVAYTLMMVPLTAGLGGLLYWGNTSGLFVQAYYWLH